MRCKGMPEAVAVGALRNSRGIDSSFQCRLQNSFRNVMPLLPARSRMNGNARRRKNVLPSPFARSIGRLAAQRERQMDAAKAIGEVLLVLRFGPHKVSLQRFGQIQWQHGYAIFAPPLRRES